MRTSRFRYMPLPVPAKIHRRTPQYRVFGLLGMLQSMLVLLYLTSRFGYELGGRIGAAAPIFLFIMIDAFLVAVMRRRAPLQKR